MISVVICTHNPRQAYLSRVAEALRLQTLPLDQWELVVVDNASSTPVMPQLDLSWHPAATIVSEPTLGLTRARLRGIGASTGDIIVFVDDDNVLDPDYLDIAVQIASARPYLAAFGANVSGEFETPPPPWYDGLLGWLAIIRVERDIWGNSYKLEQLPVGAGLCIRRDVAARYAHEVMTAPARLSLDRCGDQLFSGGDTDLALTAIDMGYGVGVFKALHLTHLIPAERLTQEYLLRLAEGMTYSKVLRGCLGRGPHVPVPAWRRRLLDFLKLPLLSRPDRQLQLACKKGASNARENAAAHQSRTLQSSSATANPPQTR